MKKFSLLFLVGVLALSMVACGNKKKEEATPDAAIEETIKDESVEVITTEPEEEVEEETDKEDSESDDVTNIGDVDITANLEPGEELVIGGVTYTEEDLAKLSEEELMGLAFQAMGEAMMNGDGFEMEQPDKYMVEELSGVTLGEAVENGYEIVGYMSSMGDVTVLLDMNTDTPEFDAMADTFEGLTIAQLKDEYDARFGCLSFNDQYILSATIGDLKISFDIEHINEAMAQQDEDDLFFDWEDTDVVQNDRIYNVEVASLQVDAALDAESNVKLEEVLEDLETEIIETMMNELVIESAGYTLSNW